MASAIRIKRRDASGAAGAPANLLHAELAFNEADKTLYYGFGSGVGSNSSSIISIAGEGAFFSKTITQDPNKVLAGPATGEDPLAPTFRLLVAADIPTLTAAKVSNFDTQVRTSRLDQMAVPTAPVALGNQKITGLADPTDAQDAATKAYVDAARSGLDVKASVRVATTANITLSGVQTIDDVILVAGDRVLVKNQSTPADNGIYVVATGSWTRAEDANSDAEVTPGMFTFVEEGTTNSDTGFVLTNNATVNLGLTGLAFAQFSGAGQITAGSGLTKNGNTIDAVGVAGRITVNADSIDIASTYVGQNTITTLGTITTGTWNGSTINVANGGTGITAAAKGSVLVANANNVLSALDGGGVDDAILVYTASTDTISWTNQIDGGTY